MPERQTKATQERHERMLLELLKLPGNDHCADCKSKNPRWASYSLGIFLCIRCAGLHRKMGTHISRVKSVTMDQWTLEQIDMIRKAGGNDNVNSKVNPHPDRHPLPISDDDGDRAMERHVRNKWEKRAFVDQPQPSMPPRPQTTLQPPQNVPKRSSSVPVLVKDTDEYPQALARLHEMGYKDDVRNRQVLRHTQGRIEAAVDILSRLPGAQRPATPQYLTDEQKMMRLNDLGYTDIPENRDALRRSGGNLEVAINILATARKPQPAEPSKPEPLSAFSSTPSTQEPAGRAQSVNERQSHKLSGGKTGDLLGLDDNKPTSNPFHISTPPVQQTPPIQQQQQSYFTTNTSNPFGITNSPSPNAMQVPFPTGVSNGFNHPQLTGYQSSPSMSPMQAGSNPFSQMNHNNSPAFTLPQRSFTAPEFPTLSQPQQQPQQQSPFAMASSLQIPQQQQQPPAMASPFGVPSQPTGFQMNAFSMANTNSAPAAGNPWASNTATNFF
ncbi:hypothetical protein BJV82DRAFT_675169 [Fennellomyces sp. T-0311]|nr:hypothetical protein BJV82DRAFT_675169 [Fennellomyces sp. T-0311]